MSVVANKATADFDGIAEHSTVESTKNLHVVTESGSGLTDRKKVQGLSLALAVVGCIAVVLLGVVIWSVDSKKGLVEPAKEGFVKAASSLASNMDTTADPCDDFAQYACGGWMKRHVIPDDMNQWSNFVILRDETAVTLLNLVNELLADTTTAQPEFLTKVLDFYKSCYDTSVMDADTEDLLKQKVAAILAAETPGAAVEMLAKYGVNAFYQLYVEPDNEDPDTNSLYMVQGALGLVTKGDYNNTDEKSDSVKEKQQDYKDYLKSLWKNYEGTTDEQAQTIQTKVYDFEECVAMKGMRTPSEERSAFSKMHSKPYSEVKDETFAEPLLVAESVGSRTSAGVEVPDTTKVMYHEDYITQTNTCLGSHLPTDDDVKQYLATRFILQFASQSKKSWRDLWWAYQQKVTKVEVKPAQWKSCISDVTRYMPEAVGRIFAAEAFKEDAKESTLSMIEDIKNAFKEILPSLEWMDEETRVAAITKAEKVGNKIGYPDWVLQDADLNKYLEKFTIDEDKLLSNTLSADSALTEKNFDAAGRPVNKGKWYMSAATVNAYYNPKGNEMVFPAAILQPPFYHVTYPKYVNYGAIGVVIGHELTHGFDDNGRKYDEKGFLKEWYTDQAKEEFQKRADCMINQYDQYSIAGSQVNGNLTLGENIADNGGVKQAFIAYRNWVKEHGKEPTLPGMSLTNEQAFFLSYAQIWCQKKTKKAFEYMTAVDPHSPGVFRIKGPLVNSQEFAEAFKCTKGRNMNPNDKCEVW